MNSLPSLMRVRPLRLLAAALPLVVLACSVSTADSVETEELGIVADAAVDANGDACADSGAASDAGSCSGESGALCIVPYGTHAGAQGRYDIFTHECHYAAMKCKEDNPKRTVGIVACKPSWTMSCDNLRSLAGHTMNWYVDGSNICIVEPQAPSIKCCFPAKKNCDGTLVLPPDVASGAGAACMAKMCGSQYEDAAAGDAASCCLPQDAGIHVPSVDGCAKQNPEEPDVCQYCCQTTGTFWDGNDGGACQEADKARYINDCNAMCNAHTH